MLFNRINSRGLIIDVDCADMGWLLHIAARQGDNLARHGRGKQHRLALGRYLRNDSFHVRKKSHIEHLVGFVEYEIPDL